MNQVVKLLSAAAAAADPLVNGVNSADEEGWAPLHSAASSGNVEIVQILLSRGEEKLHMGAAKLLMAPKNYSLRPLFGFPLWSTYMGSGVLPGTGMTRGYSNF